MSATRSLSLAVATLALATGMGCAGARTNITAPDSKYPVSLSRGVRDADGTLVPAERRIVVGHFETKSHPYSLFYSFLPLKPTTDISEEINQQVAAAGGDAVINLKVGSTQCWANWMLIFDILPIWPGCANVVIKGDIIKVRPGAAAPAGAPPPDAPAAPPSPYTPAAAPHPAGASK